MHTLCMCACTLSQAHIPCVCHHVLVVGCSKCLHMAVAMVLSIYWTMLDVVAMKANLLYCRYDPDTTDCNHREDAGVRCYPGGE